MKDEFANTNGSHRHLTTHTPSPIPIHHHQQQQQHITAFTLRDQTYLLTAAPPSTLDATLRGRRGGIRLALGTTRPPPRFPRPPSSPPRFPPRRPNIHRAPMPTTAATETAAIAGNANDDAFPEDFDTTATGADTAGTGDDSSSLEYCIDILINERERLNNCLQERAW